MQNLIRRTTMKKERQIILVDGSSYLYRAFHALPPLSGPQGQPTAVIYGVTNMLKRLLAGRQPDYFVVVFDPRGKTFRHELYPDYKANRPPMPDDLSQQIPALFELIEALGYPMMQVEKVEADDVIGTLARKARDEDMQVLISTGDKDLAQLVCGGVSLLNTMKDEYLDSEGVIGKLGVAPAQVVDYLTLTGDKSDNIPGVDGVGPKTAVKWLTKYKTLDAVIAHVADIKGKIGEKLRLAADRLPLSKELVTIRCDLDLKEEFDHFKLRAPNIERLRRLYLRLGFEKWLKELDKNRATPAEHGGDHEYQLILIQKDLNRWLKRLRQASEFAFAVAATDSDYTSARLVGIAFATPSGEAAYVPFAHRSEDVPPQLPLAETLEAMRSLLQDESIAKIGHDLKFARNVLAHYGMRLCGVRYDVMIESYVHNSVATQHDLDSLAEKYLGFARTPYEDVAGKGVKQRSLEQLDLGTACHYVAEGAALSVRLHRYFNAEFERDETQKNLYWRIEQPLISVLSDVEQCGVLLDVAKLEQQSAVLKTDIAKLEQQAYRVAGRDFNLDSPVQIRELLFDEHGLPVLRKTPKGQPSTAEDVLLELAQQYELPRLILDYRMLSKLKSTYTDKLPRMVDTTSSRIHTSYHQAVTATGRLSSSNPNLQNIPVRTPEGRQIRRAFKAPDGYRLLAADYSQIELRIMAHLSGDKRLCKAFETGQDVHTTTAAEIFSLPVEEVSHEKRRSAKAVNFGLIYGMSAFGLAKQLSLDFSSAKQYMSIYFKRYPDVRAYIEDSKEQARQCGYVETLFGRRLYLPEINSRNVQRRRYAERTAINAPMQGSAADIMKRAMIDLHKYFHAAGCDARIVMQVHDELVIEVSEKNVSRVADQCRQCMSAAAQLKVPLSVDVGVGGNWDEAH